MSPRSPATARVPALALLPLLLGRCAVEEADIEAPGSTTAEQPGTTEQETPTTGADPTTSSTGDPQPATTDNDDAASTGASSTGAPGPSCGDGVVEGDEACDDGITGNTLTGACLPGCVLATCGDGFVQAGVDECDMGAANNFEYGGCNAQTCKFNSRCGDGDLDPPHEVCDPGDPDSQDDAVDCNNACRFAGRIVFLSSIAYAGNMGGLANADKLCQGLAKSFDEAGATRYRAWLSDEQSSPLVRFDHADVPYVLRNGVQVAADFEDLITNGPAVGITLTDTDEFLTDRPVWTNTGVDGAPASGTNHCSNWGSAYFKNTARVGRNAVSVAELPDWKMFGQWTSHIDVNCSDAARLYCFEN